MTIVLPPRQAKCNDCGVKLKQAISFSFLEQGKGEWKRLDLCQICFENQQHCPIFWKHAKEAKMNLPNEKLLALLSKFEDLALSHMPEDNALAYLLGEYLVRCKLLRCSRRNSSRRGNSGQDNPGQDSGTEFKNPQHKRLYLICTPSTDQMMQAKSRLEEMIS